MSLSRNDDQPPATPAPLEAKPPENLGHGLRVQGITASDETMLRINLARSLARGISGSSTTSVMSNRSGSRENIGRRVRKRPTSLTYLPMASEAIREDEILARLWGCQPASAHTRKQSLPDQLADVVRTRRELGKTESLAAYLLPVEDALAHPTRDGHQCERCADLADASEDLAQAEYRANPCEDTARTLLRKRAADRMAALDHDREIAARWRITL